MHSPCARFVRKILQFSAQLPLVAACAMAANPAPPKFLYSTQFTPGKVAGFAVNASTGALTPTGQAPVWAHWGPVKTAADQGGYRLYVVNQGSHDLNAYFINRKNGYLTPVPHSPFAVGGTGTNLAVHPSGKFVYVTTDTSHGGNDSVTGLSLNSDGSLSPIPGSPFQTQTGPSSIAIDPSGSYVYVGHGSGYKIDAYTINKQNGALTPVPGSPFIAPQPDPEQCYLCGGGSIPELAIDAAGKYLIGPVTEDGSVIVLAIDPNTGALTNTSNSPYDDGYPDSPTSPGTRPGAVTIDPFNRFVYTNGSTSCGGYTQCDQVVTMWEFDAPTGGLTQIGNTIDAPTTCNQGYLRADPSGSFVYTAALTGCAPPKFPASIIGYSVNGSGQLPRLQGSPYSEHYSEPSQNGYQDSIAITP